MSDWEDQVDDFDYDELVDANVEGITDNLADPASSGYFDSFYDSENDVRYLRIGAAGWLYLAKILKAALDRGFDWDVIFNLTSETDDAALRQRWGLIRYLDEEKLLPADMDISSREILVSSLIVLSAPSLWRMCDYTGFTMEEVIRKL